MAFDGSHSIDRAGAARPARIGARRLALGWGAWLRGVFAVRSERRRLSEMDPRLLRDIGVSPAEAEREAHRSLWDLPANRRF